MMNRVGNFPENMGTWDRLIRAALGGWMLKAAQDPMVAPSAKSWLNLGGSLFLAYSATGYDPLWQVLGLSSKQWEQGGSLLTGAGMAGRIQQGQRQQMVSPV